MYASDGEKLEAHPGIFFKYSGFGLLPLEHNGEGKKIFYNLCEMLENPSSFCFYLLIMIK